MQLQELGWPRLLCDEEVQRILAVPGNDRCADCGAFAPSWASLTYGVVLSSHAAGARGTVKRIAWWDREALMLRFI